MLTVEGRAADRLQRMLAFTTQSPVDGWLDGFTGQIEAGGDASLDLKLTIPLAGEQGVAVRGDLHFADNALRFKSLPIPPLSKTRGRLTFTERGVDSPGLQFVGFGGPFQLKANTGVDKRMRFELTGQADSRQVLQQYLPALAPRAAGKSGYRAQFVVKQGLESGRELGSARHRLRFASAAGQGRRRGAAFAIAAAAAADARRPDPAAGVQPGGHAQRPLAVGRARRVASRRAGRRPRAGRAGGDWIGGAGGAAKVVLEDWLKLADGAQSASGEPAALPAVQLELDTPELVLPGLSLHKVNAKLGNRELSKA